MDSSNLYHYLFCLEFVVYTIKYDFLNYSFFVLVNAKLKNGQGKVRLQGERARPPVCWRTFPVTCLSFALILAKTSLENKTNNVYIYIYI